MFVSVIIDRLYLCVIYCALLWILEFNEKTYSESFIWNWGNLTVFSSSEIPFSSDLIPNNIYWVFTLDWSSAALGVWFWDFVLGSVFSVLQQKAPGWVRRPGFWPCSRASTSPISLETLPRAPSPLSNQGRKCPSLGCPCTHLCPCTCWTMCLTCLHGCLSYWMVSSCRTESVLLIPLSCPGHGPEYTLSDQQCCTTVKNTDFGLQRRSFKPQLCHLAKWLNLNFSSLLYKMGIMIPLLQIAVKIQWECKVLSMVLGTKYLANDSSIEM